MSCPSSMCDADDAPQRLPTIAENNLLSPQNWLSGARICKACGCVYSAGLIRGHLKGGLWTPQ